MPEPNEWEDLFAMLEDVHSHVRSTGRGVEIDDNPMTRRFGYKDPVAERSWSIRLTKVREAFGPGVSRTEGFSGVVCELIKTHEGRLRLANLPLVSAPVA